MFYTHEYTHCVPEIDSTYLNHVISAMIRWFREHKGLAFAVNCQGSFLEEISLYTDLSEERSGLFQVVGQHVQMSWGGAERGMHVEWEGGLCGWSRQT